MVVQRHDADQPYSQEKKPTVPFFDIEELLNHGHYFDSMKISRELRGETQEACHYFDLLVQKIKEIPIKKLLRVDNPQWNDLNKYDRALTQSPLDYIVHERFPSFLIDDVLYRFDIIQMTYGIALRIVQDVAGTVKERKKMYIERYMGLVKEEQEKELSDMLRDLLGNLRNDLRSDITAALDKATEPKRESGNASPREPQMNASRDSSTRIRSFYDSVFFMGIISQRCAVRLHPQLGLLIML